MADTPILVVAAKLNLVVVRGLLLSGSHPSTLVDNIGAPAVAAASLSGETPRLVPRTEIINPTGYAVSSWPGGFVTSIDEPVSNADGQVIFTGATNSPASLVFDPPPELSNLDTVQRIEIVIRCRELAGVGHIEVQPRIGGVARTAQSTSALTSSFQNITLTDASWNSDWTVAELTATDFLVDITARNGSSSTWEIDAIDVRIVSAVLYALEAAPNEKVLTLAGEMPLATVTYDSKVAKPPEYDVALTPTSPPLNFGIAPSATTTLSLAGNVSYIAEDLVLETLNPDFVVVRPGWEGFVSNVDEPVSSADGLTMFYDRVSGSFTTGELLKLYFPDVPSGLTDTDGSTVLNIDLVVRVRSDVVGTGSVTAATMFPWVYIDGVSQWFVPQANVAETFTNLRFSNVGVDQDWTEAQLNGLEFRVEFAFGTSSTGNPVRLEIDAVDLEITYAPQSPISIRPAVGGLALTGAAPTLFTKFNSLPAAGSQALSGQAVSLSRVDTVYPGETSLLFTQYLPTTLRAFYRFPAIDTLSLSGVAATLGSQSVLTEGSLTLAGEQPAADTIGYHTALPGLRQLTLTPESVALLTVDNETFIMPHNSAAYTGQAPSVQQTRNLWEDVPATSLALSGQVPRAEGSHVIGVAEVDLSLTGVVPVMSTNTPLPVAAASVTTASVRPQIGGGPAEGVLTGQALTYLVEHYRQPTVGSLVLTGLSPLSLVQTEQPGTGTLSFSTVGTAPSLVITSTLILGMPGIINVTVDRAIEFIAAPTIILLD